jgi:hypothetical protein
LNLGAQIPFSYVITSIVIIILVVMLGVKLVKSSPKAKSKEDK